jgi:DNA-binding NarL/FixJ family response regulator
MNRDPVSILLVDDHVLFRDGVRTLLLGDDHFVLVAEAETGEAAVLLAEQLQPDVILMDIQLPGLNGIETTRRIMQNSPHMCIMMVTMFDDDQSVFAAMRAGARGTFSKGQGTTICCAPSTPPVPDKRSSAPALPAV